MEADELERLAREFDYFARTQAALRSPLYAQLASAASRDPDVLALLEPAAPTQRRPTLLFAAVHHLLLADAGGHPLGRHYPTVTDGTVDRGDPWPAFRSFCSEHAERLRGLIVGAATHINEVARCGALMPAIALTQDRLGGGPVALLDVGASAGLHLLLDRFAYHYRGHGSVGDAGSSVFIETDVDGGLAPLVPVQLPDIAWRSGLDLDPVDLGDPQQLRWLRAMVWPDAHGAMQLLDQAIALARRHPITVHRADALQLADFVAAHVPARMPLVVMHATLLTYLPPDAIATLGDQFELVAAARGRLARVALESARALQLPGGSPAVGPQDIAAHIRFTLTLTPWNHGERHDTVLAHAGTYGQTIAWRDPATSPT